MSTLVEQFTEQLNSFRGELAEVKSIVNKAEERHRAARDAMTKVFQPNGNERASWERRAQRRSWNDPTPTDGKFGEFMKNVARFYAPNNFSDVGDVRTITKSFEHHKAVHVTKTALAEGSGNLGGWLVPPEYKNELFRAVGEKSFLFERCRKQPMAARTFFYPALDQSVAVPTEGSAFYGGVVWKWQSEGSNYNTNAQTNPSFRQIELVARDLVGTCVSSNQLLQDSPLAVEASLNGLFRDAMAWQYDYYVLQGSGANQPLGMLKSAAAISVSKATAAHVGIIDLGTMLSDLLPSCWDSAVWVAHPSVIPDLIAMTTKSEAQGSSAAWLTWLNPAPHSGEGGPLAQKIPALLLGLPLFFSEKMPRLAASNTPLLLCDPNLYLIGDRMELQIESSPYPLFPNNQMMWRIIARWDGQPMLNASITAADGTHKLSSMVYLTV